MLAFPPPERNDPSPKIRVSDVAAIVKSNWKTVLLSAGSIGLITFAIEVPLALLLEKIVELKNPAALVELEHLQDALWNATKELSPQPVLDRFSNAYLRIIRGGGGVVEEFFRNPGAVDQLRPAFAIIGALLITLFETYVALQTWGGWILLVGLVLMTAAAAYVAMQDETTREYSYYRFMYFTLLCIPGLIALSLVCVLLQLMMLAAHATLGGVIASARLMSTSAVLLAITFGLLVRSEHFASHWLVRKFLSFVVRPRRRDEPTEWGDPQV